jgi:hypothetical protein
MMQYVDDLIISLIHVTPKKHKFQTQLAMSKTHTKIVKLMMAHSTYKENNNTYYSSPCSSTSKLSFPQIICNFCKISIEAFNIQG